MITNTSKEIISIIREAGAITPNDLFNKLSISNQAIHRQLKNLIHKGALIKTGTPPRVYYSINEGPDLNHETKDLIIAEHIKKIIDENYLVITPTGELKSGWVGFSYWCNKNNLDIAKTANEYVKTISKYAKFKTNGLITGSSKLKATFKQVNVDEIFYLDFYSIERFDKTRLGQLLLYSKQSQNRELMNELVDSIRPQVLKLIKDRQIDGVAYVQPTVKRNLQFMKELEKKLNLKLHIIKILKIKTPITVPQKTLNKLESRIENAQKTFIVDDDGRYNNILVIDDAVGSGATINEIAGMIRTKGLASGKIYGLAITGSFKGFETISEV